MKYQLTVVAFGLMVLAGCTMGPNYERPKVDVPVAHRGAAPQTGETSLADTQWQDLFHDPVLTDLVRTALTQNYDMRIAAERVLQARAQLTGQRSEQFPEINGSAGFNSNKVSRIGSFRFVSRDANLDASYTQAGIGLTWELDLWGRIRRLTEAARAEYVASEEARHGVTTMLIAQVTDGYFALRALDLELEIAKKTREIAEDSLRLTRLRHDAGAATGLDVRQAEQLLYTATAQMAASERAIAQAENALSLLLGRSPGDIPRGRALEQLTGPAEIPAGLPSALLERRPDIREAEQVLIAANARIGAARAMYFPQISLTGFMGGQSRALTELFTDAARQWSFAPAAAVPIFNAGRIKSGVRLTEALQREAALNYQRIIQTAFREVADSLAGYSKTMEQREQQQKLVDALQESTRLSSLRYQGGLESYLQVLDAQRNLFQGELVLAQLRRQQLSSVVELYRALGGGWQ